MLRVIPSALFAAPFKLRSFCSSHKLIAIQNFYLNEFFKNHPRKRLFRNESLCNLENVLQRNLRTDRAREYIFRVSGGINFENFSLSANHGGAFMGSLCVPVCSIISRYYNVRKESCCLWLPKKAILQYKLSYFDDNFLKSTNSNIWFAANIIVQIIVCVKVF